jgi:hypothetical protein
VKFLVPALLVGAVVYWVKFAPLPVAAHEITPATIEEHNSQPSHSLMGKKLAIGFRSATRQR